MTVRAMVRGERGAALLEAALALGLVALVAGAGLTAFSRAAKSSAEAEATLTALAAAETALERASAAGFLASALAEGGAALEGEDWRVTGAPYASDDERAAATEAGVAPPSAGPLALIHLTAIAGLAAPERPLVRLETLRALPR